MKNEAGQGTDDFRHNDGVGQQVQHGIGRSIRPGSPVPATVLIAEMDNGGLLLQGWRAGPSAYLTAEEAMPLRQALEAAFGSEPVAGWVATKRSRELGGP